MPRESGDIRGCAEPGYRLYVLYDRRSTRHNWQIIQSVPAASVTVQDMLDYAPKHVKRAGVALMVGYTVVVADKRGSYSIPCSLPSNAAVVVLLGV